MYEDRLVRVANYIYDNVDGDLSLDRLAEVACMSRYHWHRVFRAATGETLADAVQRVRLIRAANDLVSTNSSLASVASASGYTNAAAFSRAFRRLHGMSPQAFLEHGVTIRQLLNSNTGSLKMYPVIVQDLPKLNAAGVLHLGAYTGIGRAFQKLGGIVAAHNLKQRVEAVCAIYHDAPGSRPAGELRSHAAVIVRSDFPAAIDGLEYFEVEGGKYAIMQHHGPCAMLAGAYDWLYAQWLPRSGEEPRDQPPIEVYVNDPRSTPADQLRTDIRLPLR